MLGQVAIRIIYKLICTSHIPVDRASYRIDDAVEDRYNCDLTNDTRGKEILELCIPNQLRILNGRTCGDSSGKFACFNYAGNSVVDNFIAYERLLEDFLYTSVSDFIPLLSNCHCKISLKSMSYFKREYKTENMKTIPDKYK
jgi:hypothetical protein